MYITCKCLNLTIRPKEAELTAVNIDELDLTPNDRADAFFKNDLSTTIQLDTITIEHPGLVEEKYTDNWIVHRCFNCNTNTHAVHRVHGATKILINNNIIMSEEEIGKLKTSPNYSPLFKIIIDLDTIDQLGPASEFSVPELSSNFKLALDAIDKIIKEAVQFQTRVTEERIRDFTKEQYQILEEFRERVCNERSYLSRLISKEQKNEELAETETPFLPSETIQSEKPVNDAVDAAVIFPSRNTPYRQQPAMKPVKGDHTLNGNIVNNSVQTRDRNSYDDETLFELEGMDDVPRPVNNLQDKIPLSDEDSDEDVAYISRNRGGYCSIARSLPVNVPTFCDSYDRRVIHYDDDGEKIPREPMDPNSIQASIKALAKSVHGDTPFGDLPRPRFSTQI